MNRKWLAALLAALLALALASTACAETVPGIKGIVTHVQIGPTDIESFDGYTLYRYKLKGTDYAQYFQDYLEQLIYTRSYGYVDAVFASNLEGDYSYTWYLNSPDSAPQAIGFPQNDTVYYTQMLLQVNSYVSDIIPDRKGTSEIIIELVDGLALEGEAAPVTQFGQMDDASIDAGGGSSGGSGGSSGSGGGSSGFDWDDDSGKKRERTTICTKCHGDGDITCSNCDGRGYKIKYGSTPNFSGKMGSTSYEIRESCFKCHGSGEVDCTKCGGSGKVPY